MSTQSKGVQCHECEGYGHIRSECATFLKRQKKSLVVSQSDEVDSEGDVESESAKHVTALTGRVMLDIESCDEELSYEELVVSYVELVARSTNISQMLEKQENIINQLQLERSENLAKISELNDEVTQLNSQLEHVQKHVRMMTTRTNVLEEILEGKNKEKPKSIGFDYKVLNKKQQNINYAYALEDYAMLGSLSMIKNMQLLQELMT